MQRVSEASVTVEGELVGSIGLGLVVLLGIGRDDGEPEVARLARKLVGLRVFDDEQGRMNVSLADLGDRAAALCISQFTLYGDVRRGLRPSFTDAAEPDRAERLYEAFSAELRARGTHVESGRFGARMSVRLTNEGPVTLMIEV